ncbi:MAG: hypothetical protein NC123_03595 [Butyrivibrio sp.]|nr:hypothetical protein [Acetatifactor muris]MCM1558621.1 hypothetical protein [Butyrivibrio sp.]
MRTEKEHGAMRVMEALSAVDQELLERSGKNAEKVGNKIKVRRFVRRYGAACAACICLLVTGAAFYSLSRMRMGNAGGAAKYTREMNTNGGAGDNAAPMAADVRDGGEPVEMAAGAADAPGDSLFDGEEAAWAEPEWLDVERLAALPGKMQQESATSPEAAASESVAAEAEPGRDHELQESARESEGSDGSAAQDKLKKDLAGIRAAVPGEYSPVETEAAGGATENQDSRVYAWRDGEHSLWLRVTPTELTADLRFDEEPPLYTVQEAWQDLIPDAGADGYVQFGLLYENGMLVEYRGVLEREEIIRLLEALTW